jgi:Fe-S oxidoreductase
MNENSAITREILWNVDPRWVVVLYGLSAFAGIWITLWFVRRSRVWARGTPSVTPKLQKDGFTRLANYLLTHRTIAKDRYAGVMHFFIFWGFFIELVATSLVAIQHHFHLIFLVGSTYLIFSFVSDLGGGLLAVGLGMALWRRRKHSPVTRLQEDPAITGILWLLFLITSSGFLLEAFRIATHFPSFEQWSVVGYRLASLFSSLGLTAGGAATLHSITWASHAALAVLFFVLIPLGLMRHILLGAYSVMHPRGEPGRLGLSDELFPVPIQLAAFQPLDLLQADACLTCGRCAEVCPAEAAGKPLSPRGVVLGLRLFLDSSETSLASFVPDDAIWSCTSCHACDVACPININIVDKITMLRRGKVLEGDLSEASAEALENTAQKFNPFGRPNSTRLEWAQGLQVPVAQNDEEIDLLYWVGCSGAFDPAGREVARAMIKILKQLNLSYRVLGTRERCTGDPARRLGEEGLWKELAEENLSTLNAHRVKTILTHCPHCFNAFKNEYPSLGPTPQVMHHSQWLRARLEDGTLKINSISGDKITFHDPCYLSRANHEIEAPRAILEVLHPGSSVEMEAHGEKSFCCGGGGGQLWLDVRGKERVETLRAAQVEKTGARTVATGCPFCRVMLEAGRSSLGEGQGNWRVKDLAELVTENLAPGGAP